MAREVCPYMKVVPEARDGARRGQLVAPETPVLVQKEVHGRLVLGDLYTIYNDPSITFCLVRSVATRQVQHLEDIQARDPDSEMRWTG